MNKRTKEKTNPRNATDNPWIHRHFANVEWRCMVRGVLTGQNGQQSLEDMLGSFAPSYVRGDYVPTIADAYAQALKIINATPAPCSLPVIPRQREFAYSLLTPDGLFRVELRVCPAQQKTERTK